MEYDYSFFQNHASRIRRLQAPTVYYLTNPLRQFFDSEEIARRNYEILCQPGDEDPFGFDRPSVVKLKGAYYKGGGDVAALKAGMRTHLPEDFLQFHERFGECVIFTKSRPIHLFSSLEIIALFEDDPDIEWDEGRFFRFGRYPDSRYLGLRRSDIHNEWQLVSCTYGLLYSEMIDVEGRDYIESDSFYEWIRNFIDTDGYPDNIYPRDPEEDYLLELFDPD